MKIYLVRHGETDWNVNKQIQGRNDIGINDNGRKQALQMRDKLKDVAFEVIFVSPLRRAQETATIIRESHPETPLITAPELIERYFGDYEGRINPGNYFGLWQYDNTANSNAETVIDLVHRIFPFIDGLRKKYEGKNVLLVSHGGVSLIIESYFNGIPEDNNLLNYITSNGELKIYDTDN